MIAGQGVYFRQRYRPVLNTAELEKEVVASDLLLAVGCLVRSDVPGRHSSEYRHLLLLGHFPAVLAAVLATATGIAMCRHNPTESSL